MDQPTYPAMITALKRPTRKTDRHGNKYIAQRMLVGPQKSDAPAQERTVRVFGPLAGAALGILKQGVPVPARVAYDQFSGPDGKGQSVRIISLDA